MPPYHSTHTFIHSYIHSNFHSANHSFMNPNEGVDICVIFCYIAVKKHMLKSANVIFFFNTDHTLVYCCHKQKMSTCFPVCFVQLRWRVSHAAYSFRWSTKLATHSLCYYRSEICVIRIFFNIIHKKWKKFLSFSLKNHYMIEAVHKKRFLVVQYYALFGHF